MFDCHEDRVLVSRAREGDRGAFASVVERHYPTLLSSCRRALRDGDLARDAAQQAVLTAMLGLGRLRDDDRFGAWLIGIGLNVCRSLMGPRRRSAASLEGLASRCGGSDPAASDPDLQEQLEADEVASRVREAVRQLPAGQREAVILFYVAGLTHAEIAEELGTQPGAVKTRLHKARRSLHTPLEPLWKEYFVMPAPSPDLVPVRIADLRRTTVADRVELPRPGVYHFAAALLKATGSGLGEARIVKLTDTIFFAQAVLTDGTAVDARPSDALTLADEARARIDATRSAARKQP